MEKFLQAVAKCRYCSHLRMVHQFLFDENGPCIDAEIDEFGTYEQCKCKKYAPADNLKYLEYMYEKKQDKKRKGKKK